jgi:hypothetical protein
VLEEDAHADATRNGTGQADRSEGLSGCPADGRIIPDAHGPAVHRADRDALCMGGQERRLVVEAQEKAEEAHGFERQREQGSIILIHDRADQERRQATYIQWVVSKPETSTAFVVSGYFEIPATSEAPNWNRILPLRFDFKDCLNASLNSSSGYTCSTAAESDPSATRSPSFW